MNTKHPAISDWNGNTKPDNSPTSNKLGKGTFGSSVTAKEGKENETEIHENDWKSKVNDICNESFIHQVEGSSKVPSCNTSNTQSITNQSVTLFCEMCSLEFKYLEDLKVHMQNIHIKCQKCDEEFDEP